MNMLRGARNAERVEGLSFAEAVSKKHGSENMEFKNQEGSKIQLSFKSDEEISSKYMKTYVRRVKEAGVAFEIKRIFHEEGIFSIRVTTIGENMCLLEYLIDGEVEKNLEERKEWWKVWFLEVRHWVPQDVDLERLTWMICKGFPCHAWSNGFFQMISSTLGSFIECDESTFSKVRMDVARIRIGTRCTSVISNILPVSIDGVIFRIYISEDITDFRGGKGHPKDAV